MTIRKHVVAQKALAGGYEGVSIEEAAEVGGVISGGQIVQFCLLVEMYSPGAKFAVFEDSNQVRFSGLLLLKKQLPFTQKQP